MNLFNTTLTAGVLGACCLLAGGPAAFAQGPPIDPPDASFVPIGPAGVGGPITRADDLRAADPGSWDHVDAMAERLERLSELLHEEVHAHLEGHVYFRHMDGHATEVERLANHLHEMAHAGENIPHLREDVIALDTQVHEADEVITQIARRGVRSDHYHGAVTQTRRIVREMIAIQHHLEEDLAVLDPNYRPHRAARPIYEDPYGHDAHPGRPVHTPPSWQLHRGEIDHRHDRYRDGHDRHGHGVRHRDRHDHGAAFRFQRGLAPLLHDRFRRRR